MQEIRSRQAAIWLRLDCHVATAMILCGLAASGALRVSGRAAMVATGLVGVLSFPVGVRRFASRDRETARPTDRVNSRENVTERGRLTHEKR